MGTHFFVSGLTLEWIVGLLFVAAIFAVTVGEIVWLYRQGWAEVARSICFTLVSNAVGFMVGGAIIFVIVLLLFMMTMDKKMNEMLGGEGMMWVLVVGMFSVLPVFLFLSKRLFLGAFRIRRGKQAWVFSLLSALTVIIVGLALPTIAGYLLDKVLSGR